MTEMNETNEAKDDKQNILNNNTTKKLKISPDNIEKQIETEIEQAKKQPWKAFFDFLTSFLIYSIGVILLLFLLTRGYECNNEHTYYKVEGLKLLGEQCIKQCTENPYANLDTQKCFNDCTKLDECKWKISNYDNIKWQRQPFTKETN